MKLYVINSNSQKEYLTNIAPTRLVLANQIGSKTFYLNNGHYHVNNVYAEPGIAPAVTGTVTGGLIGALAGPIGILIGAGIGILIGNGVQDEDTKKVNIFNGSIA